jgi:hypothetical protein
METSGYVIQVLDLQVVKLTRENMVPPAVNTIAFAGWNVVYLIGM